MKKAAGLRRRLAIPALALAGVALAAVVAVVTTTGARGAFKAHRVVVHVACKSGYVAEQDVKEDKDNASCSRVGGVEGPVETFTEAEQRASKATAPFQTVAPGAWANAHAQRNKKPKTGTPWQPVGTPPLYANSPTYA